jgi:hypothetical protein
MRNKKALEIVQNHRSKLDDPNYDSYYIWHQQAVSYVKTFLGEDSKEYELLNNVKFPSLIGLTKEERGKDLNLLRHVLIMNGNQMVETIRNVGIKRIYHNFLCRFSDKELVAGIFAAVTTIVVVTIFIAKAIYSHSTNP